MPAIGAAAMDFSDPSRSTVRLRSALPSGPPPAANTTAPQPPNAAAYPATSSASRSRSRTSAPASSSELAVVLAADQGHGDVPGGDEERMEEAGDLTVASDDGDARHGPTVRTRVTSLSGVEDTDRKILRLLAADGRMSFTDLGKATGLSTSAVHQRVKRLEQRGLIQGYGATVDHDQIGLPLTAFVSVTPIDASEPDNYPSRLQGIERDRVLLVGRRRRVLHPQGPRRHPRRPREPPRRDPLRRQRLHPHHHRPLHALREPPGDVGLVMWFTRPAG